MITFKFLGTSAGIPTKNRNTTGLALQFAQSRNWILVDCGEGTQRQMMQAKLSLAKISHIFITHLHGDHIFGLPGLLSSRSLLDCRAPLNIIGPVGIKNFLQHALAGSYTQLDFPIYYLEVDKNWGGLTCDGFEVNVIELCHNVPSFAFHWQQVSVEPVLDHARIKNLQIPLNEVYSRLKAKQNLILPDGKSLKYSDLIIGQPHPLSFIAGGDNANPAKLSKHLSEVDLLIHEATFLEQDMHKLREERAHSTAESVARIAEQASCPNLILTHFSPRYHVSEKDSESFLKAVEEHYKGHCYLAKDFDTFLLSKKHGLQLLERA